MNLQTVACLIFLFLLYLVSKGNSAPTETLTIFVTLNNDKVDVKTLEVVVSNEANAPPNFWYAIATPDPDPKPCNTDLHGFLIKKETENQVTDQLKELRKIYMANKENMKKSSMFYHAKLEICGGKTTHFKNTMQREHTTKNKDHKLAIKEVFATAYTQLQPKEIAFPVYKLQGNSQTPLNPRLEDYYMFYGFNDALQ